VKANDMHRTWFIIKRHIHIIVAVVMLGLGLNAIQGVSPVIEHYETWGFSRAFLAGILFGGAIITAFIRSPYAFILGTLPYAIYVITTISIVMQRAAGYPVAIIYTFSYIQLLALYNEQEEH